MTYDTVALKALAALSRLAYAVGSTLVPVSAAGVATVCRGGEWVDGKTYAQPGYGEAELVVASQAVWVVAVSPGSPSVDEPHGLSEICVATDGYVWRRLASTDLSTLKFSWYSGVVVPDVPFAGVYTQVGGATTGFTSPCVVGSLDALAGRRPYVKAGGKAKPRVVVADGVFPGVGATATVTLAAGGVSSLSPTSNGSGYTNAVATVIGDGVGAEVTCNLAGGEVVGYTVVTPGTGYTHAEVVVTPGERAAVWEGSQAPLVSWLADVKTVVTTDVLDVPAGVTATLVAAGVPLGAPTPLASGVAAKINTVISPE